MLKIAILAVLYELSIVALVQERVVKVTVALARAMIPMIQGCDWLLDAVLTVSYTHLTLPTTPYV